MPVRSLFTAVRHCSDSPLRRSSTCPNAYCEDHLPLDAGIINTCERYQALGQRHPNQACFVHCSAGCDQFARSSEYTEVCGRPAFSRAGVNVSAAISATATSAAPAAAKAASGETVFRPSGGALAAGAGKSHQQGQSAANWPAKGGYGQMVIIAIAKLKERGGEARPNTT